MEETMAKPAYPTVEEIARFWSQVDVRGRNECWLWKGRVNGDGRYSGGYGQLSLKNKGAVLAHRLAYEIANGSANIKAHPDWVVGHLCMNFDDTLPSDRRRCCNPRHLDLTTRSSDKRRHSRIKKRPARISKDAVRDLLRKCLVRKEHYLDAMASLGLTLTTTTVWNIVCGNSHKKIRAQFLKAHSMNEDQAADAIKEARRSRSKADKTKKSRRTVP
jgi:hypothetical protein